MGIKQKIANVLCSPILGRVVRQLSAKYLKRNGIYIDIENALIKDDVIMKLFWNLYEKSEISLVKEYISGEFPVVELGGSIGVVSSVIGSQISPQKLISVESNSNLIASIESNLKLNNIENFTVIHGAISNSDKSYFLPGELSTGGTVSTNFISGSVEVPTLSLGDLAKEYLLNEYTLVSDIEGAERSFIIDKPGDLEKCKAMVIELHRVQGKNGSFCEVLDLKQAIKKCGFKILDDRGPVIYASKI